MKNPIQSNPQTDDILLPSNALALRISDLQKVNYHSIIHALGLIYFDSKKTTKTHLKSSTSSNCYCLRNETKSNIDNGAIIEALITV